jgi:uncharacterized repeat protein (TIGR03803 family)
LTNAQISNLSKFACIILLCCCAATASAANFKKLANFNATDGAIPYATLIQATDGDFYGTTLSGGANLGDCAFGLGCGTVVKITPRGKLTTLYSFCAQENCADGSQPYSSLIQSADGNFYGTTSSGGSNDAQICPDGGCGTVFKITPGGVLTTLYSFCALTNCTDGALPLAGLVQATDGSLYGTTYLGGSNGNYGTLFSITPSGALTTLYSFCAETNCSDGANPTAGLVQATDGNFYGTTQLGGTINACNGPCGTVFAITPGGTLTTLHSFDGTDGNYPEAGVIQSSDGIFYGTTPGERGTCCGTIFTITSGGTFSLLHTFNGTDGDDPFAGVIQATDGNFYGTTIGGGAHRDGTVFKITAGGTLTTLRSFSAPHAKNPAAGLVQATNGSFYGTTAWGGQVGKCVYNDERGCGTAYKLSVGLGAHVLGLKY